MRYFLILLSLLFIAQPQSAHSQSQTVSITATGEVELPADQVFFNININAEAESPQAAYDLHQQREKALVQLLEEYDVSEDNIRYEPISISKKNNYNNNSERETTYQTNQSVKVKLSNFDVYESIQIGLIENNYDNFNGSFTSSDHEKGQEKALRKAIQQAKNKAGIIADEADLDLGSIFEISYNYSQPRPYVRDTMEMKVQSDAGSLLKYNQTITVSATVSVKYALDL